MYCTCIKRVAVNSYTVCVLLVGESICLLFRGADRSYTLIHSVWLMGVVANNRSLAAVLQEKCSCKRRFSLAYKMHFCKWPPVCNFSRENWHVRCCRRVYICFLALTQLPPPTSTSRHCFYWNKRVLYLLRKMSKWETFVFIIVLFLSNISYFCAFSFWAHPLYIPN
jgi:hypothetical protein